MNWFLSKLGMTPDERISNLVSLILAGTLPLFAAAIVEHLP